MAEPIQVNFQAIALSSGKRPKAGAKPKADGDYALEDMEVFVGFSVGCHRPGGLLTKEGAIQGQMVPVGEVSRPLLSFMQDAHMAINGREAIEQAKLDGET